MEDAYNSKCKVSNRIYKDVIKIPLRFTYGANPESICKMHEYNGADHVVKTMH